MDKKPMLDLSIHMPPIYSGPLKLIVPRYTGVVKNNAKISPIHLCYTAYFAKGRCFRLG